MWTPVAPQIPLTTAQDAECLDDVIKGQFWAKDSCCMEERSEEHDDLTGKMLK